MVSDERFLDYDKSLACIHCGLCLASCPTYLETGNENDSPRGRIYIMRALQDGRLPVADTSVRHIDLCLGCRACEAVCPSGVQYGELLEGTRNHIEKRYARSAYQNVLRRFVIEKIFPVPWRMKLALAPARLLKALRLDRLLPKSLREGMALIPNQLLRVALPEFSGALTPKPRGRVGFVSGCVMSVMFGETNRASVELLNRAGYDVVTPRGQGCCGALFAHGGNLARARDCARRNIEAFERANVDAIIINAAGCGSTLKEYGHLLHGDSPWTKRGESFSGKVKDITEWLAPFVLPASAGRETSEQAKARTTNAELVTYHDACHLAHAQRITKQPRELIKAVAGKQFVELPESDVCCGSAGSYNLTEPEMAARLQTRKIQNILKTGTKTVVTSNPGCILQIETGLRRAGANIRVVHIADFLLERSKAIAVPTTKA
jgi:glycolate oxidase iron-sulfur subunit